MVYKCAGIILRRLIKEIFGFAEGVIFEIKPLKLDMLLFNAFETGMDFFTGIVHNKKISCQMDLPELKQHYTEPADRICAHRFELPGSGLVSPGENINWHMDFKSGFVWPLKYYKRIRISNPSNNADVKVPWELSRFHQLIILGQAYYLSSDEKYAREFKEQIKSWITSNPAGMSVNWVCSMEVAIRAVNWITGYFFFKHSPSIDMFFWNLFNKTLYLHGLFIFSNLENKSAYTNNHFIADLAGLVWLGLYFKDFRLQCKNASSSPYVWLDYGLTGLNKEMSIQVNDDGTHYEASTYYHKYVTEMLLLTAILCERNGYRFSEGFNSKLEKMCVFIMDIVKPDGLSPLIGDADDGRFLPFSGYCQGTGKDFRHVLAAAGGYFDRDDFKSLSGHCSGPSGHCRDAFWISGKTCEVRSVMQKSLSRAYKDGGYYILRNERVFCLIRCGPLSCRGAGGHSHNDQLSFELFVDGSDFFVDPGTCVYTADYSRRNLFRSTSVHNTLCIDGYEQNDFEKSKLFSMPEQTFAICTEISQTDFRGRHSGYKNKCGLVYERYIKLRDNGLDIEDILVGSPEKNATWYLNFTLDPQVEICHTGTGLQLVNGSTVIRLSAGINADLQIINGYISKAYGSLEKTRRIIIRNKAVNYPFYTKLIF